MSYVIVCFAPVAPFVARVLHGHGSPASALSQAGAFPYPFNVWADEQEARREASSMSRLFGRGAGMNATARYAVFRLSDVTWSDDAVDVSGTDEPSVTLLISRPLFVPAGSEDLAVFYRWESFLAGDATLSGVVPYASPSASLVSAAAELALRPIPPAPVVSADAGAPLVRFEVRAGLNGTNRDEWSCVHQADNGKEAAAWVAGRKADYQESGKTLAIVRVVIDPAAPAVDWRERERARLASGEYAPLPGDWASKINLAYPDHFAHVASSDKRKVAFTETDAAGERDRQKVLSASAYVERFFSDMDNYYSRVPERQVRYWHSGEREAFLSDMMGGSINVLFAPLGDAAAMARVYRDTCGGIAHGCMSGDADNYYSRKADGRHPTAAYAEGGEITIALLRGFADGVNEDGDEDEDGVDPSATWDGSGRVLARCLVWPKGKEYGRVYGSALHARMLRTALEAQGYEDGDLEGARIAKIPVPEYGNSFVMPYLDIGGGRITDYGCHFKVGGDIAATRTDGLVRCVVTVECENCHDDEDEDTMETVHVGEDDSETWCRSCRDQDAFYCGQVGGYVSDRYQATYYPSGSRFEDYIADWMLSEVGAVECSDGSYRVDAFVCADCDEGFPESECHSWGERETGNAYHSEGDSLCSSCHDEREELADAHEAESSDEDEDGAAIAA